MIYYYGWSVMKFLSKWIFILLNSITIILIIATQNGITRFYASWFRKFIDFVRTYVPTYYVRQANFSDDAPRTRITRDYGWNSVVSWASSKTFKKKKKKLWVYLFFYIFIHTAVCTNFQKWVTIYSNIICLYNRQKKLRTYLISTAIQVLYAK